MSRKNVKYLIFGAFIGLQQGTIASEKPRGTNDWLLAKINSRGSVITPNNVVKGIIMPSIRRSLIHNKKSPIFGPFLYVLGRAMVKGDKEGNSSYMKIERESDDVIKFSLSPSPQFAKDNSATLIVSKDKAIVLKTVNGVKKEIISGNDKQNSLPKLFDFSKLCADSAIEKGNSSRIITNPDRQDSQFYFCWKTAKHKIDKPYPGQRWSRHPGNVVDGRSGGWIQD